MIEINNDNYFEIAEALHAVMNQYHDGGYGYEVLCMSKFNPGYGWSESIVEAENEYFAEIEALAKLDDNYCAIAELMTNLNKFVDNKTE